jgi:hypothetical protein
MTVDTAAPEEAARKSLTGPLVIRASIALAVVALIATMGWMWHHPTAFSPHGNAVGQRLEGNEPIYLGLGSGGDDASGTVTIHSVKANLVEGHTNTKIEFFVCTLAPGVDGVGTAYESDLAQFCSMLTPAGEGATLRLDANPAQTFLIAVDQPDPGRVQVHGVDVSYSYRWQRGTQRIGPDITVVRAAR